MKGGVKQLFDVAKVIQGTGLPKPESLTESSQFELNGEPTVVFKNRDLHDWMFQSSQNAHDKFCAKIGRTRRCR
jgi:hypothetical protein